MRFESKFRKAVDEEKRIIDEIKAANKKKK